MSRAMPSLLPIGIVGLWRWATFVVRVLGWACYSPRKPADGDALRPSDVTIVVPTIDFDEASLEDAVRSWVVNEPRHIIFVTIADARRRLEAFAERFPGLITVIVSGVANKRVQMVKGIRACRTKLVCFADDDAVWRDTFLRWLVAPFSGDDRLGGVGSNQVMRPCDLQNAPTAFERIADLRLSGRMMEACASTVFDGSVSCLSGRTAVYHTKIFDETFESEFVGETWFGNQLISGDDKFMTRWLVKKGWNMTIQVSPECTLATTFRPDAAFFKQVLRWTRNTWRSDMKSLFFERHIWLRYPFQALMMCDRMLSPLTLLSGPVLFGVSVARSQNWLMLSSIYVLWITISRSTRMLVHFRRCPGDIAYLPTFIGYQYYFAVLKLYALCTLNVTAWGTRESVEFKDVARAPVSRDAYRRAETSRSKRVADLVRASDADYMRHIHKHVYEI